MSTFLRWSKFNLVGAIGMAAQLAVLVIITHCLPGHYLIATAVAVEFTLLHNFVWHLHFTWQDRCESSAVFTCLVRFHLSNGLVSMLGNLALIHLLILDAHLPLLIANVIAILACSLINFFLGDSWVFASSRTHSLSASCETRFPAHM